MPSTPSSSPTSPWVLNYACVVGVSTPLGIVVIAGLGASIPWQYFIGATLLALASLQCASGRRLYGDIAQLVRAWSGVKRDK